MTDTPATSGENAIRNVSDTALWVAIYRAMESERPDAIFRDPYARRLGGERGKRQKKSAGKRGGKREPLGLQVVHHGSSDWRPVHMP